MPAFVVFPDPGGGLKGGPPAWGSGFLPASFQGTPMRAGRNPILHLQPPSQISGAQQKGTLDLVRQMNWQHLLHRAADDELSARIDAYELAFRMQMAAPAIVDLTGETQQTLKNYGIDRRETADFGTRCLLARRMMEQGVRFVQLYSGDTNGWDAHNDVGLRAVTSPVHVHDLHATILHLLGLDHEQLTFFRNGRDERLTDVAGKVVHDVLA